MPAYCNGRCCMPSIENLRKQAKRILRWHREKHYPVAALIRSHLPKFAPLTDPEIMESPFMLTDAQELVAKQEGFDSWQALLKGDMQMTESTQSTISFVRAEPQLLVKDIQ